MGSKLPPKVDKPMALRHVKDRIEMNRSHAREHARAAAKTSDKKRKAYHEDHAKGHMKDLAKARKHLSKVKEV